MQSLILNALLALVAASVTSANSDPLQQILAQDIVRNHGDKTARPNIIVILTDDQDLLLDSLSYTPITIRELKEKGTYYKNHFVTTALCCPSRVSLWTGRQAHNTNVTDVNVPYG
jgi:Sulfatase